MTRLRPLVVGLLLLAGCTVDFVEPAGRSCDDSHACPPNQVCVDQRCQVFSQELPDGGSTDGGLPDAGIPDPVEVSVSPTMVLLAPFKTQSFTATVLHAANTNVIWSVQEGAAGGTIDASGLYTAPATEGTFHVVATSVQDPSKSATATVTVAVLPADLVLHFSADQLLGQGTALPADGTPVSSWVDLSGNARDLAQPEAARQPRFKATGLNGRPTVAFDGSLAADEGDYLRSDPFTSTLSQPLTVFLIYKAPPVDTNKTLIDAPLTAGANRIRLQATTIPVGGIQLYSSKFASPGTQKTVGTFYYLTAVFSGPSSRLRGNGVEENLPNRDPGTLGMGGLMLGGRQDLLATSFAETELAELLVFGRLLSEPEIVHVEAYLRERYFP